MHMVLDFPATSLEESYSSFELEFAYMDVIREAYMLEIKGSALSCVNIIMETQLLTEDAAKIRTNLSNALKRIVEIIEKLTRKFEHLVASLTGRNKKWVTRVKSQLADANVADNFKYEMYPYWTNLSKLVSYQIPEFQESNEEFMNSLSSESTFQEKYFKEFYIQVDGKTVYDPKTYFRGKSSKIIVDKKTLLSHMAGMIQYVENYEQNANKVIAQNKKLIEIIGRAAGKVKTAPINETSFIMESIMLMLEDTEDKPATSGDVEKEENKSDDPAKSGGNEGEKTATGVKNLANSRQVYARACYEVNGARMLTMETAYNDYVRCLSAALRSQKKKG